MNQENKIFGQKIILNTEQDALLDLYLNKLDMYMEDLKESEKIQAKIETLHLKKMLTK